MADRSGGVRHPAATGGRPMVVFDRHSWQSCAVRSWDRPAARPLPPLLLVPGPLRLPHVRVAGGVMTGLDLLTRYPEIPPERLAAPTLGAYRREHGIDDWPLEARHLFAVTVVEEARRRLVLERLSGTYRFLEVGGTVDQATAQLLALTDTLTAGPPSAVAA